MSRIGKAPVPIPQGVAVRLEGGTVTAEGPRGTLSWTLPKEIAVVRDGKRLVLRAADDSRESRSLHGLSRSLVANMITGVSEGFRKELMIEGIGYRAQVLGGGRILGLALGYSHPIEYHLPEGISATVEKGTKVVIEGSDKQLVGEVAAQIRRLRPVEPYKGKGIRYAGERVRRKVGKA